MNAQSPISLRITKADMAERRRVMRDEAVDQIETLETALDALKYEARINPFGYGSSAEMLAFLVACDRFTATDSHAEYREQIENDLFGGEAA